MNFEAAVRATAWQAGARMSGVSEELWRMTRAWADASCVAACRQAADTRLWICCGWRLRWQSHLLLRMALCHGWRLLRAATCCALVRWTTSAIFHAHTHTHYTTHTHLTPTPHTHHTLHTHHCVPPFSFLCSEHETPFYLHACRLCQGTWQLTCWLHDETWPHAVFGFLPRRACSVAPGIVAAACCFPSPTGRVQDGGEGWLCCSSA